MSISEQIVTAKEKLVSLKDELVEVTKSLEENADDATLLESIDSLSNEIETKTKSLDALNRAENTLALKAVELAEGDIAKAPNVVNSNHIKRSEGDLLVKTALCTFEAYCKRVPVSQIVDERYGSSEQVKTVCEYTTKAAQNPALSNVAGWAQELTRETYAEFMNLLQPESVIPKLNLSMHEFQGFSSIKIPMRKAAASPADMAGAFRAEGAPIRVGAASLATKTLTPKTMGIIGTFSNEIFERSQPNIENLIRQFMIEDTSLAIETAFFGSAAGSVTQPAGIQNGIAAGDTAVSGGKTAAAITDDIRGRLAALSSHNLGRNPYFVMNPARFWGVSLALTATGTKAFPETENGVLLGIPVVTSTNIPADVVYLIDSPEISMASGSPTFMGTEVATIHEENTSPAPIVTSVPATANPVRSLFQTNSSALRMMLTLDWAVMRAGAVQTITACDW